MLGTSAVCRHVVPKRFTITGLDLHKERQCGPGRPLLFSLGEAGPCEMQESGLWPDPTVL